MNPFSVSSPKHEAMITTLNRINKELLKVTHDIDSLNLQTQQLGVDLHSFMLNWKEKMKLDSPLSQSKGVKIMQVMRWTLTYLHMR